jgi:regulator of sirC expression with transglutaminase-like and TPR domain
MLRYHRRAMKPCAALLIPILPILPILLTGCPSSEEWRPGPLARELLSQARRARLEGLLGDGTLGALEVERAAPRRMTRLVALARARVGDRRGERALEALRRLVFDELRFRREVDDDHLRFTLLPQVLASRRGGCLGLGGLYLVLGEALDLPLRGVLVPGHFFVRLEPHNVELLKRGRQMPRSWYVRKYAPPSGNPLYLETGLDRRQASAVFRYNLANAHRSAGDLRAALALYRDVVRVLPGFAEAQANMGLTLHRLGRLDEAEQAYKRALRANPALDGLEQNLKALRAARR